MTTKTGIITTRSRVILLAVVIPEQFSVHGLGNAHVDERSGLGGAGEEDLAVDVGRVGLAAAEPALGEPVVTLAEDAERLADAGGVEFVHYARLQLAHELGAPLCDGSRRDVRHLGGGRPLLGREREHADALHARLAQEVHELVKLGLALAGKARYERRADDDAGYLAAEPSYQLAYLAAAPAPVHALQNGVVYVLDGDVDVLDDLGVRRDLAYQRAVNFVGIEVVQPDALYAVYL